MSVYFYSEDGVTRKLVHWKDNHRMPHDLAGQSLAEPHRAMRIACG